MLSEYRERFDQFHTEWRREEFLGRAEGRGREDRSRLWSEHSDLFTPARIEELRAVRAEIAAHRETERRSAELLIAFAVEGALQLRVREIDREIARYEAAARIAWKETAIGLAEADALLAQETEAAARADLFARRADVEAGAGDLYAERLARWREGAREYGFADLIAMRRELRGLDPAPLRGAAERLLSQTESAFVAALAAMLPRETGRSIDDATEAELPLLRRFPRFDLHFPADRMAAIYRDLFADLGFKTGGQTQLSIGAAPRGAFFVPIRVPDEIRLGQPRNGGQQPYGEFLFAAGRAQHAAWTSRTLHPEFRRGGDAAVGRAWGLLLENLLLDSSWLMNAFGFAENEQFRRGRGVVRWLDLRRDAAALLHELDLHAGLLSHPAESWRERLTDASRIRCLSHGHLRGLAFAPADRLRAAAFDAQLREYLRTRYGSRWWASRKAGEMLIDLWNTGQRHTLDELARMIGLGDLDFDWLLATADLAAPA